MTLRVKSKVWLENAEGETIIGEGRLRILKAIRDTGSMSRTAVKLNQTYRRVWSKIKDAERHCGFKLVERTSKGSRLTEKAEELLTRYMELSRTCSGYADNKFRKLFGKNRPED
jgi:molybdate transport system regulatory protein